MSKYFLAFFIFCFISPPLWGQKSAAADFTISPVRIFFDNRTQTAILTITNESAEDLTLQLKTFSWQQDETGKDVYSPTEDIIFFPKIFKIQGGEEKIVRLGTKIPPARHEKTYRLYLEEIPAAQADGAAVVRILMKIGVPIFIKPLEEEIKGSLVRAELQNGTLALTVNNEGNIHFVIRKISVTGKNYAGKEVFTTETGGGYLHGNVSKGFEIKMPADACPDAATLEINIDTDRHSIDDEINISKEMCRP
ncbi:MAG: molecular chaperone [Deltaproteobacteria bacterium]|nr:molecular chaperone [Deltaproteobacteria bacterium]